MEFTRVVNRDLFVLFSRFMVIHPDLFSRSINVFEI